jgi:hypothetical protein
MASLVESVPGVTARSFSTLGQAFLSAESASPARIVTQQRADNRWQEMPAWRFFRQIVRVGLYLRERARLAAGDNVVTILPPCTERLVVQWAVVAQGGVVATLDPGLTDAALASALGQVTPRVAFVGGSLDGRRVIQLARTATLVALEEQGKSWGSTSTWPEVLDLGGTLDTAERAQSFRAQARALGPEMPAVYPAIGPHDGSPQKTLSHGEMALLLEDFARRVPANDGDVAYVVEGQPAGGQATPLWSFVADGRTRIAFGDTAHEAQDIAEIRPHLLVSPRDFARRATAEGANRGRSWSVGRKVERLPLLASLVAPLLPRQRELERLPRTLTLEGVPFD